MTRAIGNAAILLAGAILMIPLLLSIGILFSAGFFVLLLQKTKAQTCAPRRLRLRGSLSS